jgi:hypothetical protein
MYADAADAAAETMLTPMWATSSRGAASGADPGAAKGARLIGAVGGSCEEQMTLRAR